MKKAILVSAVLSAVMCGCGRWGIIRRPRAPMMLEDYPELHAALERNHVVVENKVLVLLFWTRPCPHCVNSTIPHMKTLYGNYGRAALEIVGVNADTSLDRGTLLEFISRNRIKYPNIFDDDRIGGELEIDGFPTICVFDREGVLIEDDFDPCDEGGLDELIAGLLEGEE